MTVQIKFGTSGWRAVIADEFTLASVRRAAAGIALYVKGQHGPGAKVLVGRDARYMGERFVEVAANVLSAYGLQPVIVVEPAATPAVSYEVIRAGLAGAINVTASHNPADYSGIKFSSSDGAPALPEVTRAIEKLIPINDPELGPALATAEEADPRPPYLARLKEIIDFPLIRASGLEVVFDPFWGAGRKYSDTLLRDAGIPVTTVHDYRDVLFGGHAPEPDDALFDDLRAAMKETGARLGIATDGDADRFGVVDEDGTFIQPNYVIAVLFDYLVESRGWKNGVGKSVTTTNLVNALAEYHGVELHETPVGFKYIGELIKQDKIAIGGEESAGLSIRHHVPEKDGILAGLLCCEAVARRKKPLQQQIRDLFGKVGSFYPERDNFRLTDDVKTKFTDKLKNDPVELAGRKVKQVVRTDGLKLVFADGSWVCFRLSGTEPVVRIYSEAKSPEDLQKLAAEAKNWVFS
jgi:phosphoglucomutase